MSYCLNEHTKRKIKMTYCTEIFTIKSPSFRTISYLIRPRDLLYLELTQNYWTSPSLSFSFQFVSLNQLFYFHSPLPCLPPLLGQTPYNVARRTLSSYSFLSFLRSLHWEVSVSLQRPKESSVFSSATFLDSLPLRPAFDFNTFPSNLYPIICEIA